MTRLPDTARGADNPMTIGRPQMEKQIRGYNEGGAPEDPEAERRKAIQVTFPEAERRKAIQVDFPDEMEMLQYLLSGAGLQPDPISARISDVRSRLKVPTIEEGVAKYTPALRNIYARQPRSRSERFYDMASTVGGAMLASDPSAGAFRSMGAGLAQYGKEESARRAERLKEDRAVAIKAFELAKTDQDAANKMLNEYDLLVAKDSGADYKTKGYKVISPQGLIVGGVHYPQDSTVQLTPREAYAHRTRTKPAPTPSNGVTNLRGEPAVYQSEQDAKKTIKMLGMTEDSPYFEMTWRKLVPEDETMIGQSIIVNGSYANLRTTWKNDEVVHITFDAPAANRTPSAEYAIGRLKTIQKNRDQYLSGIATVQPELERAMYLLLEGIETGGLTEFTLPFRQLLVDAFGTSDPQLVGQESLIGMSNMLATKMRPVGSGSTSDMEFKAYQRAILSLGNTPQANYIALYVYSKMQRNLAEMNEKEMEMLSEGKYTLNQVNEEVAKIGDQGIFAKIGKSDPTADEITSWMNSLPRGTVFINKDASGNDLVSGAGPYIIAGWGR